MEITTLKQVIEENIKLPKKSNSRGWYPVLCKVCNDHGRKGPRAGFMFNGTKVAYHCFNCDHRAVYDPTEYTSLSENMTTVLKAFDVPEERWQQVIFTALQQKDQYGFQPTETKPTKSFEPAAIQLPDFFLPITDSASDGDTHQALQYLQSRGIDWHDYPFYIPKFSIDSDYEKWKGRIIIPIYNGKNVVFYVGRDFTDSLMKKYLNPPIDRDNIIFGYDQLEKDTDQPLYITEGWFDAFVTDGVAVFGNRMTPGQIHWINQSRRKKVVIPDRWGQGHLLAEQAIKLGWSISTPDIGSCKDLNEAFVKYGKMYLLKTMAENIAEGFSAQANVSVYCRNLADDDTGPSKAKNKKAHQKLRL